MSRTRATLGSTGVFADVQLPPRSEVTPPAATARPDREGRAALPFWTTAAAKKQLRLLAATLDTTQQHLMTEALNDLFKKHGKPPIA
jgi:Antitoxin-like ribbon-helix-helix